MELKGKQCCLFMRKHFLPFEKSRENFIKLPESFFCKNYSILTLLETNRSVLNQQLCVRSKKEKSFSFCVFVYILFVFVYILCVFVYDFLGSQS